MAEKKKPDEQSSKGTQLATFGGIGAAVALAQKGVDGPLKAIRKAEELRKAGAGRKQIHAETSKMLDNSPYAGIYYGADKHPRFEIDDSGAKLHRAAVPSGGKAFAKDVLEHPALYDAYPTAQHITVEKNDKPGSQIKGNSIKLSQKRFAKTPLMGREVLAPETRGHMLHELQHHIQDREGHAPGGDPSDFDKHPKWGNDPAKKELAYRMLAGEQEANMTMDRQHMTAAQRRATMPVPEVPEAHQIVLKPGEGTRSRLDVASLSDAVRSAFDAIRNKDAAEGKAIRYRKVDPATVNVDADTFQFKSGGDAAGVTDRLRGVKSWDPVAAGKSIMWERADGQLFVGDGHQRTGLAKRLQAEGQTGIRMDAAILRERDGWSAKDVRVFAAMKNIKEGSGTSLDMAKVMRERPDLVNNSLPMSDAKVRDAVSLSKLSPDAFGMVINGVVKPEHAAAVAAVGDSSRHASMLGEMAKAEIASSQHARLYVQQAMAAPQYTETTGSLFGEETQTRSLLSERAKVLDKAIQALKSDKKIFGLLEREAGQIEAAGNKLAHDVNAARAEGAGRTAELVERLAQNRGPVSDMLDRAARAVADGEGPAKAARSFVREVHDTLKSGGMAGLTGDAPKPVTFADPNQENMFGGGERKGWSDEARAASAEVRAENAKGAKVKKPRKQSMMDSERPPRLGKGRTSVSAAKKWEAEFRAIPQDDAEKRLLARKQGERIGKESKRAKSMADDMFGGPSTKDKIAAAARAKEAKGRTGDPMNVGLFGSSKDQMDLVDRAKEKPPVTKESIVAKHKKDMARIEAKHARADRKGKKAAAMAKIKDELRETFARDPNGKQRNTKGELLSVRRGAEDVALKGGELTAVVNGKRVPVQSWEQLSSALRNTIDATGVGASQTPAVRVVDHNGKVIAHVSYNGKVWPGDVSEWKSGIKPLYEPKGPANSPQFDPTLQKAADVHAKIDRLEALGYEPYREAARALNMDDSGGNNAIRRRIAEAAKHDFTGRLDQVVSEFEGKARAKGEAELRSLVAKTGAPADVQEKAVAAGMAESDRVGKKLLAENAERRAGGSKPLPADHPARRISSALADRGISTAEDAYKLFKADAEMASIQAPSKGQSVQDYVAAASQKVRTSAMYDVASKGAQQGLRSGDMEMLKRTIKSGVGEGLSARHAALLETATNAQLSELDTFAHEARKGSARTDVDFNRIGAFRQKIRDLARTQSDAAAQAQIEGKGPAGWSDAARAASAEARGVAAPGEGDKYRMLPNGDKMMSSAEVKRRMAEAKALPKSDPTRSLKIESVKVLAGTAWRPDGSAYSPGLQKLMGDTLKADQEKAFAQTKRGKRANAPRMADPAVKDLLKKGLVTKEDVKTSASMSDLKAKARESATQKLIDRGAEPGSKIVSQAVDDMVEKPLQKRGKRAVVKLGDGRNMPVGAYAEAWKKAKSMPPDAPVRGTPSDPAGGGTAKDVVREMRAGMEDRINRKDPRYGKGRKWDDTWQNDARRLKDTLGRKSEVPAGEAHPVELRPRLAEAGRLAEGTPLPPKGGDRSKAKPRAKKATPEPTSGLRGTQNAANLEAIIENRKANAADLTAAAKSAGVVDPNAQMHEMFAAPKKEMPHQMTPAGQESRYISRMRAGGSNKTDAELKADFAKSPRKGIGKKALGLLTPIAIGTAMLAASNQAKAEGLDRDAEFKEAAKAGAHTGATVAAFTLGTAATVKGLMKVGMTAARAVPLVQGAMMAGGAVYEGVQSYRHGGSAKDIVMAAGKGAWDMSLPGMVVNTARDAKAVIDDRKAIEQTPRVAGMQRFNEVAAQYKKRATEARSPVVAPVEPSDGDNKPRGWANAKVQAAAQEAKGRKFSGVFKDGSHAQMQQ